MTPEELNTHLDASLRLAEIAAPIYAGYLTFNTMKKSEAMRLAIKDASALGGAASHYLLEGINGVRRSDV